MRRCSRPVHRSLGELNVTPLLDLAFVLLVVFLITTAPSAPDARVQLPLASAPPHEPTPRTHDLTRLGSDTWVLDHAPISAVTLAAEVARLRRHDPRVQIVVHADARAPYTEILRFVEGLQQAGVDRIELATRPRPATGG